MGTSRDEHNRSDLSVQQLLDMSGRRVLVTGAAGEGGFGRQIATSLAEAGAEVVITSRDKTKAEKRAAVMQAQGLSASGMCLDLRDEESVKRLVLEVSDALGPIDVLFNNASDNALSSVEEVTLDDWNRVMAVNVTGAMLLSRAVAPSMLDRGRGVIVNIASIYGVVAPDQRIYGASGLNSPLVYGVSKAALIQMTRYMSTYWAPKIRVNSITPGGLFNDQQPDFISRYQERTPLGCMAGPSDLKGAALFLASDASSWVTGANLVVDGGWTTW